MITSSRNDTAAPEVLWDMLDGLMPRGLLGNGDPDVHVIDGRWTMFLGGFSTSFRDRLYRATLADGAELSSGRWSLLRRACSRSPCVENYPIIGFADVISRRELSTRST
ncbi:hypothetical protein GIY23_10520 [Allosaccharopolyspora coralli]|uniref:Uncharacterized protein n=1 Tax=Allosaccharopolyspora coralli TaxID=2665642 RepID=A0A5Q3Q8Z3_9PSEU|nr:hypothetical protein [Allosaccharopolyspora coralli]QGK69896.1 hypothetical protein GIY23_10520 [Allosaccharopolyspora coralli]